MSRPLRSDYLTHVRRTRRSERGIVLAIVLVMIFALVTAVYAFQHRALIDNTIAANRLESAEADALAKGGLRLAEVIVMIVRAKYDQGDAGSSGLGSGGGRSALLCPPLESLSLVRLLDSLRGGRCNCPVALTGHMSVGYVSVEIPRHRPCPLTGLPVNRLEPLTRCPTQPVAIQHILSPAASPLAVAVVWARAPDLPPSHRRHRRRGQGAPPPVDPPPLPGSVYWSFIAVQPLSSSGLNCG